MYIVTKLLSKVNWLTGVVYGWQASLMPSCLSFSCSSILSCILGILTNSALPSSYSSANLVNSWPPLEELAVGDARCASLSLGGLSDDVLEDLELMLSQLLSLVSSSVKYTLAAPSSRRVFTDCSKRARCFWLKTPIASRSGSPICLQISRSS